MVLEVRKKVRGKSFLRTSPSVVGIVEILELLEKNPMYYRQIFRVTKIRFAPALLKYLGYCKEKGFVTSEEQLMKIPNGRGYNNKAKHFTVYSVTKKGMLFLELVK